MDVKEKKMAAALAAVSAYMQREEENLQRQIEAVMAPPKSAPAVAMNLWGQSGRQSMMQLRNMMQLKGFHRNG
jgi:hypothetical protein